MTKHDEIAAELEATGDFRVCRRISPDFRHLPVRPATGPTLRVMFLDSETTGLDPVQDAAISMGYSVIEIDEQEGHLVCVIAAKEHFEDPGRPISPDAFAVHGISLEDVAGKRFPDSEIEMDVARCDLIVAHNAGFDRPMLEKRLSCLKTKPWACSANDIDWSAIAATRKLEFLLFRVGYFHDAHGAMQDTAAQVYAVTLTKGKDGNPVVRQLVAAARRAKHHIWALDTAFETKDALKQRGYHWNDGTDGQPKAWHITVDESARDAELEFLRGVRFKGRPQARVETLSPVDRFTSRISAQAVIDLTVKQDFTLTGDEAPRARVRP